MVCLPHIVMVPEKGSKGKIDPSRGLAPGGADTLAAGRNGPAALQGCADAGSWPAAAVAVVRRRGKRGCNTDGRDHSARRSKTPPDIRCRGKCAAAKPLRREPPCPSQTGGWTTAAVHVRLEPVGCGDPLRVAGRDPAGANGWVPHSPAFGNIHQFKRASDDDRTDDCAPAPQMMSPYAGQSSKNDDFR
jgi:hypothetical protein